MQLPPVAILAGGLATRLRPITHTIPKSLVLVVGKPFIAHQLMLLKKSGVANVVLCVGHLADQIIGFVGNGSQFGLDVKYSHDGDRQMGTGGALLKALPMLGEWFFVMYGDSYLEAPIQNIAKAFKESRRPAMMTVYQNEGKFDTSNVIFADGIVQKYDKKNIVPEMRHIDYGLGVLSASTFDGCTLDKPFDLAQVYTNLAQTGELAGFEVMKRFYEIGSPEGLSQTSDYLRAVSTH